MHLDTVCTMVDRDAVVMYPPLADTLEAFVVEPGCVSGPEPFVRVAATVMDLPRRPRGSSSIGAAASTPSREDVGSLKKVVAAAALLAVLCVAAVAHGDVVQNFNFSIKDVKSGGRFTVVFNSQSYDPTGGVPDPLTQNYIRLPKGAVLRKQFLNKKYYCDLKKLVDQLRMNHPNAT